MQRTDPRGGQSIVPPSAGSGRREAIAGALLIAHVVIAAAIVTWHPVYAEADDVARFVQVATREGVPYRDFDVEYAPAETILIDVAFDTESISRAIGRTAIVSLVCDLGIFFLLRRWKGLSTGVAYLALSLPLQVFMPFRLDLITVVSLVAAFVIAREGKERPAGALFALAVLFKLWPLVLLPVFALNGWWRSLRWSVGLSLVGLGAWALVVGPDAVRYVTSFRGATGWQVESTVGAALSVLRYPMRTEEGAVRVGTIPGWTPPLLSVATIAVLFLVWRKASRSDAVPEGFPALAAVASLTALSPVMSAQYVAWLLPWAAIALTERSRPVLGVVVGITSVLAAAVFLEYWAIVGGEFELAWLAFARALAVISIPILWFTAPRRSSISSVGPAERSPATATDGARSAREA
jgi:hypothetical protein